MADDIKSYTGKMQEREVEEGKGGKMVLEWDLTQSGEHTIQYTDDVLWNYIPETYIILLTYT